VEKKKGPWEGKPTKIPSTPPELKSEERKGYQFDFGKPLEELTPEQRRLSQLKPVTPEGRKLGFKKMQENRLLDKTLKENFKRNALAFRSVLAEIPDMTGIDVMRFCVHMAMAEEDWETAAKWAKELAEYEKPKLQRVEKISKEDTSKMTDEELLAKAVEEGLLPQGTLLSAGIPLFNGSDKMDKLKAVKQ
jgi:hypothetical protein